MRPDLFSVALALVVNVTAAPKIEGKSYNGYRVIRVETNGRSGAIHDKLSGLSYEQWNQDVDHHMDILLAPDQVDAFQSLRLDSKVLHENLGKSIAAESQWTSKYKRQANDLAWYDSYHDYEDHINYIRDLQKLFPDNSEIISTGESYEKRDIVGIHLYGADGPGKPAVLYHATVHAREWIAAPVVEYIAYQLVTGYKNNDDITRGFLDSYDFYIFPVVNPDGFVYSQTTDRLWRKNRQPPPSSAQNQSCIGRDINRNWEFAWDANPRGASTNPCSEVYRGEKASDSPENQGLDKFMRKLRDGAGIKLYVDWHSYGEYILSPVGYRETYYAPDLGKWTKTATLMSQAIRDSSDRHTTFTFGPTASTLYVVTGSSTDHIWNVGEAVFSYTIELPDTGDYGFVLPPEQIKNVAEEQWAGQQVLFSLLNETFFDGEGPA